MRFPSHAAPPPPGPDFKAPNAARHVGAHVAGAVMLFALVQLWATGAVVSAGGPHWLPLVGIAVLVLGAIPTGRMVERRWHHRGRNIAPSPKADARYRRDLTLMWSAALLVPPAWVLVISSLVAGAII